MNDFTIYLAWGWEHIISIQAIDHILFIAALTVIFDWHEWKKLLVLVTAFTIGHFITLWLSVLDLIRFSSTWVEFLIPLTIVLTALVNMFNLQARFSIRLHYALALGFGLVHGMGYANAIRFSLMEEQSLALSLLAFNTGLEIGQLFVVLALLLLGALFTHFAKLGKRTWIVGMSVIILLWSLSMVVERIPNN